MTEATTAKHGDKWTCDKCGTKFYDLKKRGPNAGAMCPECGAEVIKVVKLPPGTARKPKSRSAFSRTRPVPVEKKAEDEEADDTLDDDDDKDGLPEVDDDDDDDATIPGADDDDDDGAKSTGGTD